MDIFIHSGTMEVEDRGYRTSPTRCIQVRRSRRRKSITGDGDDCCFELLFIRSEFLCPDLLVMLQPLCSCRAEPSGPPAADNSICSFLAGPGPAKPFLGSSSGNVSGCCSFQTASWRPMHGIVMTTPYASNAMITFVSLGGLWASSYLFHGDTLHRNLLYSTVRPAMLSVASCN